MTTLRAFRRSAASNTVVRTAGIALACLVLQQSRTTAEQPPAEKPKQVTGKVQDRDGKGLAEATVTFDGPKQDTVTTDALGLFRFTGPQGTYAITVTLGERSKSFSASIGKSGLSPATFTLDTTDAVPPDSRRGAERRT